MAGRKKKQEDDTDRGEIMAPDGTTLHLDGTPMDDNSDAGRNGRPPIEIDWRLVGNMIAQNNTQADIAAVLEISEDSLLRHCKAKFGVTYAVFARQHKSKGDVSLRRQLWKIAMQNNPHGAQMAKFLAVNRLGMHNGNANLNITTNDREQKRDYALGFDPRELDLETRKKILAAAAKAQDEE